MPEFSHKHTDRGRQGEDYIARQYDLEPCDGADWCDLVNPRTNTKHEVKVAAPGRRFRVWEDNHRSMVASDAGNVAWYHFLEVTMGGNVVRERKVEPSTVTTIVEFRGGWNTSGHRRGSRQHKIPIGDVF